MELGESLEECTRHKKMQHFHEESKVRIRVNSIRMQELPSWVAFSEYFIIDGRMQVRCTAHP